MSSNNTSTLFSAISDYLRNNTPKEILETIATIVAILASIFAAIYCTINAAYFIFLKGYLSQFDVSINSINYSSQGLFGMLYKLPLFIGIVIIISILYISIKKIKNAFESTKQSSCITKVKSFLKKLVRDFISIIIIIYFINYLLVIYYLPNMLFIHSSPLSILKALSLCLLAEIIYTLVLLILIKFYEKQKELDTLATYAENNLQKPFLFRIILSAPVISFFFIFASFYFLGYATSDLKISLPVIENKYVAVYQDDTYYWTVEGTIEKNKIVSIDTTKQKAIEISNTDIVLCLKDIQN